MPPDPTTPRWTAYMGLDDLLAAPRNPKDHDLPGIGRSIGRFGVIDLITIDERTGRIISGHGRLESITAARDSQAEAPDGVTVSEDGDWLVPVTRGWASKDDDEADSALIALNQLTIVAGWDDALLAPMLVELRDKDADLFELTGYTNGLLDVMLADLAEPVVAELDPDSQPRLDQFKAVTCPECGHEFHPSA